MLGGNSSASARSKDASLIILDEFEEFPDDLDQQGSSKKTYEGRMAAKGGQGKMLIISSPVEMERSKIWAEFLLGSQEYYYVPCPFCNHLQVMKWANFVWYKKDIESIRLKCTNQACDKLIEEKHKTLMMAEDNGARWKAHNLDRDDKYTRSFHLSSLYAPLGFKSWKDILKDWFEAQGHIEKLKAFVLLNLGEPWVDKEEDETSLDELMDRRRKYSAECEKGVLLLTASGDLQKDRIEVLVLGWGINGKCWVVDYQIFYAPEGRTITHPKPWDELEIFRRRTYKHESGIDMRIVGLGIDTAGGYEQQAYNFVKGKMGQRVYAFKGASTHGKPLVSRPTKSNKGGISLFLIGTDTGKSTVFGMLKAKKPNDFGYVSFHETLDDEFFKQLLSERLKLVRRATKNKFITVREYVKIRPRNEVLDMFVYGLATLHLINPNWVSLSETFKEVDIKEVDKEPEYDSEDITFPEETEENEQEDKQKGLDYTKEYRKQQISQAQPARPSRTQRPKRNGGFVNGWK